jgi:hypothetical protein
MEYFYETKVTLTHDNFVTTGVGIALARHSRRRRGDAIRLALVVAGALLHCDELRK